MPRIVCSIGVSPAYAQSYDESVEASLREAAKAKQVRAIGSCGLDARCDEMQVQVFERQIALAKELDLALIVEADGMGSRALEILEHAGLPKRGVMLRAKGVPLDQLSAWADAGCFISLGAEVASDPIAYCACARTLPVERLLVESGAPASGIPALSGTSPRCDQVVFVEDVLQGIFSPNQLVANWCELFG